MYIHEIGRIDAEPYGAARDRADRRRPRRSLARAHEYAVARQERREVRLARDRPDAGPAAAVRNAERLVQVEVRHVGAELARRREADERVQVRAVDVHLPAVRVDDLADARRCPARTRRASTDT